jgi:hypothetical protein
MEAADKGNLQITSRGVWYSARMACGGVWYSARMACGGVWYSARMACGGVWYSARTACGGVWYVPKIYTYTILPSPKHLYLQPLTHEALHVPLNKYNINLSYPSSGAEGAVAGQLPDRQGWLPRLFVWVDTPPSLPGAALPTSPKSTLTLLQSPVTTKT